MATKLITPPTDTPVSLAEAKAHLRVSFDDDDLLIASCINAAVDYVQRFTGRALIDQTWETVLDKFPESGIPLSNPPLIQVVGVFYFDASGIEQTVDSELYTVDSVSEPAWVVPDTGGWPTTLSAINTVRVRYRAGWETADDVPASIKAAVLLLVGTLYEHRETIVIGVTPSKVPWSAEQLMRPYRVHTAIA